jgi:hypothetical protein
MQGVRLGTKVSGTWERSSGVLAVIVVVVLLAGILGRMLDFGIRRDEMLFVPPAALLGEWRLYADFFYNHVPLSAWIFRGFHLIAPDTGILLGSRLAVFMGWLLLVGSTYYIVGRLSQSRLFAFISVIALLTNDVLLGQAGMAASNNLLPLPFIVLGLGFFLIGLIEEDRRPVHAFLSGLFLVLAATAKINAGPILLVVLASALFLPRELGLSERFRKFILPGLIGGLLGAIPVLPYLIADPAGLFAHLVGFHLGPHVEYWKAFRDTEPGLAMGLRGKLLLAYDAWLSGPALLYTLGVLVAVWIALSSGRGRAGREALHVGAFATALAALLFAAVLSFVPTPGFPQYYSQPLACLPLLGAIAVRSLDRNGHDILAPTFVGAIVLMVALAVPRLGPDYASLSAPGQTEAGRFAAGGAALRLALATAGAAEGPVATFMPLYPLEGGLSVYPEFATGSFAFRIAEFTPPDLARSFVSVGPDGVDALFETNPPAAFLLGYEPELEAAFERYAQRMGYQEVPIEGLDNRYGEGKLLVRRMPVSN